MAHAREDRRALLLAALATLYVVWGSTYLAIRVVVETIPALLGAGARFLAAGGLLAALLVVRDGWARLRVTRSEAAGAVAVSAFTLYAAFSLLFLGYLVGPGSILGYTAFVWLLQNAPVSTATTYAYVNPVVAVFLGWLVLSESVTVTIAVGGGVIVAAVVLIVRQEARPADEPQPSGAA